jgi:hypothetical protein
MASFKWGCAPLPGESGRFGCAGDGVRLGGVADLVDAVAAVLGKWVRPVPVSRIQQAPGPAAADVSSRH